MKLSACEEGCNYTIESFLLDDKTEKRLLLLGVKSGAKICLIKGSAGASLVLVEGKLIALGKSLCENIQVMQISATKTADIEVASTK